MSVYNRPFDDAQHDFEKMWRLLEADFEYRRDDYIWHVSRLGDWKYGLWNEKNLIPSFFRDHAQLWIDSFGEVLAFLLSEDGSDIFFIVTRPGFDYLYPHILDWAIEHWQPRWGQIRTEVHERQTAALSALEHRGFMNTGVVATTRVYNLLATVRATPELASDFHIVDLAENSDYDGKAALNLNGFEGKNVVTEFDLLRFAYSRENPAYDPYLDLSVVTTEGLQVSSCVGFCDPAHGVAEVEKICTHNQYRRLGLAQAAVLECFRRLREYGIERAYITGYSLEANGLYEKLQPRQHKQWYHYRTTAS